MYSSNGSGREAGWMYSLKDRGLSKCNTDTSCMMIFLSPEEQRETFNNSSAVKIRKIIGASWHTDQTRDADGSPPPGSSPRSRRLAFYRTHLLLPASVQETRLQSVLIFWERKTETRLFWPGSRQHCRRRCIERLWGCSIRRGWHHHTCVLHSSAGRSDMGILPVLRPLHWWSDRDSPVLLFRYVRVLEFMLRNETSSQRMSRT